MMKVERLHFQVRPDKVEDFINADTKVWTSWLQRQPGYINKQYIRYPAGQLTILVFWKDEKSMVRATKQPGYHAIEPQMKAEAGEVYRLVSSS
jgi:uncharacterized protein (TIGR03792 family)